MHTAKQTLSYLRAMAYCLPKVEQAFDKTDFAGYPVVYRKCMDQQSITVKQVKQRNQYRLITSWLCEQLDMEDDRRHRFGQYIREMYAAINNSNYCRSYLLYENGHAQSTAEITDAMKNDISLHFEVRPGDVKLQIMISPIDREQPTSFGKMVMSMVEMVFLGCAQTKRVLLPMNELPEGVHLMDMLGFTCERKPETTIRVYICTRERFEQVYKLPYKRWSIEY